MNFDNTGVAYLEVKHKDYKLCMAVLFSCGFENARAEDEDLCRSGEIIIAACQLSADNTRHSICGAGANKIIYRSGTLDKIELVVEFTEASPISRWINRGTYTTYFGFRAGDFAHIFGVPEEKYGAVAFLALTKNNIRERTTACMHNSFGDKKFPSKAIRDVDGEYAIPASLRALDNN